LGSRRASLLFDGVAQEQGQRAFGIFEITGVGLVAATVSAIYNRTVYWDERVEMMHWWSDWLDGLKASDAMIKAPSRGPQVIAAGGLHGRPTAKSPEKSGLFVHQRVPEDR
jgi:hypothetical protein